MQSRIKAHMRRQQHGFFHVMLLVFVLLGISVWGISELLQRTVERRNEINTQSDANLEGIRKSLLSYAILSPPRTESVSEPGLYNIYQENGGRIPFRPFSLPCPDLAADSFFDGLSDGVSHPCGGASGQPSVGGAYTFRRFGRLPWRDAVAASAGYTYVRGVDGRDLRDGYNQRFWYGLSDNVAQVQSPLNPHALLRLTTGWWSVVNQNGDTLSDRVAVVVVAPGLGNGGVPSEELLYRGGGAAPLTIVAPTAPLADLAASVSVLYRGYFDDSLYVGLTNASPVIRISTDAGEARADKLEYLTVDDLAAANGEGVSLLWQTDFLSRLARATVLLDAHLSEFGYLPAPALPLNENGGESRRRPAGGVARTDSAVGTQDALLLVSSTVTMLTTTVTLGAPPTQTTNTVTTAMTAFSTSTLTVAVGAQQGRGERGLRTRFSVSGGRVVVPLSEMPPIYLAQAAGFTAYVDTAVITPPYNIPLADLDTALNNTALPAAASMSLVAASHYPTVGLFGINNPGLFTVDASQVVMAATVSRSTPATLRGGSDIVAVLADSAYGYFQDSVLVSLIAYSGGVLNSASIENLPPYSAKVLLPAGTFVTLRSDDVVLRLPANYNLIGTYDPQTGEWALNSSPGQALAIEAGSNPNALLTVSGVPDNLDVIAGNVGFLPVGRASVVSLSHASTVLLSGGRNAISNFDVAMNVYAVASLTVVPFPPPGRPVVGGVTGSPLPTPLRVAAGSEFILPPGTRLVYPEGGTFPIGDDFSFPDETIAQIPAGASLTLLLPPNAVAPDGGTANGGTATITAAVAFPHGALLQMQAVRPVFADDAGIASSQQKIFDVELRDGATFVSLTRATVGGNLTTLTTSVTVAGEPIIQPFVGRLIETDAPLSLAGGGDVVFYSDNRVRAKFLTHPKHIPLLDFGEAYESRANAGVTLSSLRALTGSGAPSPLSVTIVAEFDEDTEFLLPAGLPMTISYGTLSVGTGMVTVAQEFVLPAGSRVFDPDLISLLATATTAAGELPFAVVVGEPLTLRLADGLTTETTLRMTVTTFVGPVLMTITSTTTVTVARGLAENRLMLFPEADVRFYSAAAATPTASIILGGSRVDLLSGLSYPPGAVPRLRRAADDVQLVSEGQMHLYLGRPATLRYDLPTTEVDVDVNNSVVLRQTLPPSQLAVRYYNDGASLGVDLTLVRDVHMPANTFIAVPSGREFDFLSSMGDSPAAAATVSDTSRLPAEAAAVVLPGGTIVAPALTAQITNTLTMSMTVTTAAMTTTMTTAAMTTTMTAAVTTTMTTAAATATMTTAAVTATMVTTTFQFTVFTVTASIAGPAYMALGSGNNALALVNHSDYLSGDPLIFLTQRGYLVNRLPVAGALRREMYAPVPPVARLGIRGEIEYRSADNFFGDLAPLADVELFSDFPMLYAVAADCRRASSSGRDCAEGAGRGLEFELQSGEEYVLRQPLEAPAGAGVLLRAAVAGISLSVQLFTPGTAAAQLLTVEQLFIDPTTGMVTLLGASVQPNAHDQLVVGVQDGAAPLRSYFDAALAATSLDGRHYVETEGLLSVYVGGYLGGNYDTAAAAVTLPMSSRINLGVGAKLRGGERGEKVFGANAAAVLTVGGNTLTTDMSDYVLTDASAYQLRMTLSSDSADVDLFGGLRGQGGSGDLLTVSALGVNIAAGGGNAAAAAPITLPTGSYIEMEPGYLWQGYIPPSVVMAFSQNASLTAFFAPTAYLRVQPTSPALNFFGSGVERPEGMDGLSFAGGASLTAAAVNINVPAGATNAGYAGFVGGAASLAVSVVVRDLATGEQSTQRGFYRPESLASPPQVGHLRWHYTGDPFTDPAELITAGSPINAVGEAVSLGVWATRAQSSFIEGITIGGAASSVLFYPPNYQVVVTRSAPVPLAWNTPYFGLRANLVNIESGVVGGGSGAGFSLRVDGQAPRAVPQAPLSAPPSGYSVTALASLAREFSSGVTQVVTTHSDVIFYLDRAYNQLTTELRQSLVMGGDFNISGPGAIVPPFGGRNARAVADVYAERSNLVNAVLNYSPLHDIYDRMTGQCVSGSSNDCEAMYDTPDWFPVLGGVLAFDAVNVNVSLNSAAGSNDLSQNVRLVQPQPQALVRDAGGQVLLTLYAGSIIYPRRGIVYPATPLPAGAYTLHVGSGGAAAAVDVSPVIAPRPVRFYRPASNVMGAGEFNYAPISVNASVVVEPLAFAAAEIYDLADITNVTVNAATGSSVTSQIVVSTPAALDEIKRYDGTFSRGFLLNPQGATLIADYYGGNTLLFSAKNGYSAANSTLAANRLPFKNYDIALGNPLAYRWTADNAGHLLPAGGIQSLTVAAGNTVRVSGSPFSAVGLSLSSSGDEFTGLRLAHRIAIPANSAVPVFGYRGASPYPSAPQNMFQFPTRSSALVMNNDIGSWLSAHPYLSRYQVSLRVIKLGGNAATLTIAANNDGFRQIDLGGRRVLHYHRSESLPADPLFSATPVHTNVWIRLSSGGVLTGAGGNVIALPSDTLLNPLLGTYILQTESSFSGKAREIELQNNYRAEAEILSASVAVVRPALIIPAGLTLVVGSRGGNIRNVKAALIFSLTPLSSVDCPIGGFNAVSGQGGDAAANRLSIDQVREGVSDNRYQTATGQTLGLGHPCAWVDDRENLDGDRFYIYRGRRRYVNEQLQIRVLSNDRTFLLGGTLEVRV